jgi:hypothetical protein
MPYISRDLRLTLYSPDVFMLVKAIDRFPKPVRRSLTSVATGWHRSVLADALEHASRARDGCKTAEKSR